MVSIRRCRPGVKVSTIRTALMKAGKAFVQAGGGWVNDSVPEKEYEETVNKAKSMFQTIALAQTINKKERG